MAEPAKTNTINAEDVAKFRTDLLDGDAEGSFYPSDIEKVKTNDHYCQRFLNHQGSVENAVKMAKDALKWRKEFGVEGIKPENFPEDLWKLGSLYPHGQDKGGHSMLIFHVKKHKKDANWSLFQKQMVIYWFEKLEKEGNGKQISVIFDCIGSGLSNMDMDIMRFIVDAFKLYYPNFLSYILVIEIPWVLNAAWKIIQMWLPPSSIDKIKFLKRKAVTEYVEPSQLLECMGGEDKYEFKYEPATS